MKYINNPTIIDLFELQKKSIETSILKPQIGVTFEEPLCPDDNTERLYNVFDLELNSAQQNKALAHALSLGMPSKDDLIYCFDQATAHIATEIDHLVDDYYYDHLKYQIELLHSIFDQILYKKSLKMVVHKDDFYRVKDVVFSNQLDSYYLLARNFYLVEYCKAYLQHQKNKPNKLFSFSRVNIPFDDFVSILEQWFKTKFGLSYLADFHLVGYDLHTGQAQYYL